jgi:hypothetical protein
MRHARPLNRDADVDGRNDAHRSSFPRLVRAHMPSSTRVSAPTPRASGSLSMRTRARRATDAVARVLARSRATPRVHNVCALAVVVIAPNDVVVVDAHSCVSECGTRSLSTSTHLAARTRDSHARASPR